MFNKMRNDLVQALSCIELIIVNAAIFESDNIREIAQEGHLLPNAIWLEKLKTFHVGCVAYSPNESRDLSAVAERLGIVLKPRVDDSGEFYRKTKTKYRLADEQIALILAESSDTSIAGHAVFSAAPPDAPLDIKAVSYYPTYDTGAGALIEIAELIVRSKKYPGGWSD